MESPSDQEILKNFGKSLEKHLIASGMSQFDLAAIIGKDQAQISRYIAGEVNPTLTTIYRLAEGLSVSPSELLPAF